MRIHVNINAYRDRFAIVMTRAQEACWKMIFVGVSNHVHALAMAGAHAGVAPAPALGEFESESVPLAVGVDINRSENGALPVSMGCR